jgi:membrane protease YdiL (CAAX protease family)
VFLGMLGVVIVFLIVCGVAAVLAYHGDVTAIRANIIPLSVAGQCLIDAAVVIYLVLTLPGIGKTTLRGYGFTAPNARQIGIAAIGALLMIVVVNGLGSIIDAALHTKHQQQVIQLFLAERDPLIKAGFALLAVVVAPVAEEFAFRVFIFNAVRARGGFWVGAVVSGIVFGIAHTDPYAFVPLVLGGMILCGVYMRSQNAYMSMITHGLFNAVSVVALFLFPQTVK